MLGGTEIVIIVLLFVLPAAVVAWVANQRGANPWIYGVIALLLGPVGLLLLFTLIGRRRSA